MPKLSYAQIAQKSKETSSDIVNSTDRCMSEFDEVQPAVKDGGQSLSSAGVEPRPQRGGTMTGGMNADSRPAHSHHTHSHWRQRGGGHVAAADDMRHRDYNGIASAARPLP